MQTVFGELCWMHALLRKSLTEKRKVKRKLPWCRLEHHMAAVISPTSTSIMDGIECWTTARNKKKERCFSGSERLLKEVALHLWVSTWLLVLRRAEGSCLSLPASWQHSSALNHSVSNWITVGFSSSSIIFFDHHLCASVRVRGIYLPTNIPENWVICKIFPWKDIFHVVLCLFLVTLKTKLFWL